MDFIWKNKGPLAVASVLTSFFADPQAYISGAKELIIEPIVTPIVKNTNWTLIITSVMVVVFLPAIVRSIAKARAGINNNKQNT